MKKYWLIIFFVGLGSSLAAQPFQFDINLGMGLPQGDFKDELDRNSFGADLAFTYQIPFTAIHIGAGVGYQNYGWRERYTNLNDVPEVDLKVRTTNNILTPHALVRVEAPYGFARPFIEGSIGLNYLYTESSLVDDWDGEDIASQVNYDHFTTNTGIGGGMKIKLYEGFDEDGDFFGVSLMLKAKYMLGGDARYLREGDLSRDGRNLNFNVRQSRTDLTTFNIGVSLNF